MILLLLEQLKRHEGLRLKPYQCTADKRTIGYGRNLEDRGITAEEAEYLLNNDIEWAVDTAQLCFANYERLSDVRKSVLANMAFNLGLDRLKYFYKMRKCVESDDFDGAAREMLDSLWARQVGRRANELAELMREG